MRAFRLDEREFSDGDPIPYRGDCYQMLTCGEKVVEDALRLHSPCSAGTRSRAQYFYIDECYARRMARLSKQLGQGWRRYLYEVDIADCDILHQGDLNHYSAMKNAARDGLSLNEHVAAYWSGEAAGGEWTSPRYELLALTAVVVRKL